MTEPIPALLPTSLVYGAEQPDALDPAEIFHEASKLQPSLRRSQAAGIVRLGTDPTLQAITSRQTGRRNRQRPSSALPAIDADASPARGRSPSSFTSCALRLETLATLVHAGYGVTSERRRTVPSGGALYPLELYPVAQRVRGLEDGVYRYDPACHALEPIRIRPVSDAVEALCALDGLLRNAALVVFITAVFWRTRFKYGLRGYRFALLEAGHCAQNMLLAAHTRHVEALPLGGYYDNLAECLLEVDGVDESVVYAVAFGGDA